MLEFEYGKWRWHASGDGIIETSLGSQRCGRIARQPWVLAGRLPERFIEAGELVRLGEMVSPAELRAYLATALAVAEVIAPGQPVVFQVGRKDVDGYRRLAARLGRRLSLLQGSLRGDEPIRDVVDGLVHVDEQLVQIDPAACLPAGHVRRLAGLLPLPSGRQGGG